ncbi:MAG: 50S ribosomal protein L7/L12 [Okeania sp. SIO2G4]|uniref:50S ribosomal protein L7/L12 n=1 Tax=unclassified Okeania TaxID=2634635 RepID=UPI0013B8C4E3|nr:MULTISPECIES: 50S ribosomal protein L7/L12 [unclassified Okeania]NEP05737.1 50S ribosomal protein L7/L12 [Okeania sp. SIO4D6]NEP74317.1 50S ribosomal protein L7/L12 [Okeania sp. SIO2G5]NEP96747.1 50S ribosomal protein L7/L12 [Okeania sp. SIO2F5]NEQ93128.1 50S ribosomal protein L7/L12 [Okeania sp. SIO2G4]
MSIKTDEILEELKYITMLEATELVKQIEDCFQVSADRIIAVKPNDKFDNNDKDDHEPQTIFDIVLEGFPANKKISFIKEIRSLNLFGSLQETKKVVDNLPQIIQSNVNIQEAEQIKQKLEELGATVSLK